MQRNNDFENQILSHEIQTNTKILNVNNFALSTMLVELYPNIAACDDILQFLCPNLNDFSINSSINLLI